MARILLIDDDASLQTQVLYGSVAPPAGDPLLVPCHRVVASDGGLGGFSGGLDIKRALLRAEGHATV